jgi:arylsulfatase A-like enzyme
VPATGGGLRENWRRSPRATKIAIAVGDDTLARVRNLTALVLPLALVPSLATAAAHPVFDLVANRALAHASRNGALSIAAGGSGFARYIHFSRPLATWKLRQTEEGHKVALAQAQAWLEVPLTAAEAKGGTITMRLKSPVKQTVRASMKSLSSPAVPLGDGWQTIAIAMPAGALVEGENKILLTFANTGHFGDKKASAAVEWIDVGAKSSATAAPQIFDGRALQIPAASSLSWYVQVPDKGALIAHVDGAGCTLKVSATAHGGSGGGTLTDTAPVDLSSLAGKVARLTIAAEGTCAAAKIASAALTTDGDAPSVVHAPAPKNVVFWMTDDTRSDKYKLYNPKTRVETPVVDGFAKKATVFNVAYVQGNESRVSHASLWTSLYPLRHQFISEKAKLDPKFVTLAEAVKPTGRYTEGLMANGFIDAFWGFGEGWDALHNFIHEGGGLKAEDLVHAASAFLKQHGDKPYFLYLGTIDAHVSWRAHQPWIGKYDPEPYAGPFVKACLDPQLDKIVAGKMAITERDKTRIIALYDSDVSYNDQQFGELLKQLSLDDTMIIYTADHGEELWDHGKIGHGQSLREELVHVPLLIAYPPLFPAGKRVAEGVEIIDLLPTIVDALGGKVPADAQGESLVGLAQGEGAGYPRPAIGSQYELAHTMRLSRWKLWVGGSGDVRLFDAAGDAAEAHELSAERPLERRFVTDALGMWMAYQAQWKKSRWGVASNQKAQLPADLD